MKLDLPKLLMLISRYSLRLFIIQLIGLNFVLANTSSSQNLDEIKVSLSLKKATITEVFEAIEGKTQFVFAYPESIKKSNEFFTAEYTDASLRKILEDLSAQGRIQFKRIRNTISVAHIEIAPQKIPPIITIISISGKVTDEENQPLPGVNVVVKGTSNGTVTDSDGMYNLSVPDDERDAILVFSFIGYRTIEELIGGRTNIDVALPPDVQTLGEVIVVGYGTQKKSDVTGAITTIDSKTFSEIPSANIGLALRSLGAGVDIRTNNGNPHPAARPQIRIRGSRSLAGGNDPLIVVDGIPYDGNLNDIAVET
jgi:TonB-dependent starch-binding outer membrane protein SusC